MILNPCAVTGLSFRLLFSCGRIGLNHKAGFEQTQIVINIPQRYDEPGVKVSDLLVGQASRLKEPVFPFEAGCFIEFEKVG